MEARSSMLAVTNMSGACVNRDAAGSGSDSLILRGDYGERMGAASPGARSVVRVSQPVRGDEIRFGQGDSNSRVPGSLGHPVTLAMPRQAQSRCRLGGGRSHDSGAPVGSVAFLEGQRDRRPAGVRNLAL